MKFFEAMAYDFDYSSGDINTGMPSAPKFSPMDTVYFSKGYASIESAQSSGATISYNIVILSPPNVSRRSFIIDEKDLSVDSKGKITLNKTLDTDNLFTDNSKIINPLPQ
jgi:hypothetical protein